MRALTPRGRLAALLLVLALAAAVGWSLRGAPALAAHGGDLDSRGVVLGGDDR